MHICHESSTLSKGNAAKIRRSFESLKRGGAEGSENWYMGTPEEQMYYLEEKVESCELMEITNMDEWFNLSKVY